MKNRPYKSKFKTVVKRVIRPQNLNIEAHPLHYQPPPTPQPGPPRSPTPEIDIAETPNEVKRPVGVVEVFLAESQKAGKAKWTGDVNTEDRQMEFGQVTFGLAKNTSPEGNDHGNSAGPAAAARRAPRPMITREKADLLLDGVQDDLIHTVQCWAAECTEMNARMQHLEETGDTLAIEKLRTLILVLRLATQVTNLLADKNHLESDWNRGEDIKRKATKFKNKIHAFLVLIRRMKKSVDGIRVASHRIVDWIKDSEALFSAAFGALYPNPYQTLLPKPDVETLVNRTMALKKYFDRIEDLKDQAISDAKLAARMIQICCQIQVPRARFAVEALLLLPDYIINVFKHLRSPRLLTRIDEINLLLEQDQKNPVIAESKKCKKRRESTARAEELVTRLSTGEKQLLYLYGYPERMGWKLC